MQYEYLSDLDLIINQSTTDITGLASQTAQSLDDSHSKPKCLIIYTSNHNADDASSQLLGHSWTIGNVEHSLQWRPRRA